MHTHSTGILGDAQICHPLGLCHRLGNLRKPRGCYRHTVELFPEQLAIGMKHQLALEVVVTYFAYSGLTMRFTMIAAAMAIIGILLVFNKLFS